MKKTLCLIFTAIITIAAFTQPIVNTVNADTFKIAKRDNTPAEFILKNATRNITGGVLTNIGNGKTAFTSPNFGTILNGNGFVKANGTTISYDNTTYQPLLGYTPYNATNPNGYINSITSANVTTALGYTPYNATNPNGYITSSALPIAGNPSNTIGLGAINGTATTFMRSDATHAINQAIAPTWTGVHRFNNNVGINITPTMALQVFGQCEFGRNSTDFGGAADVNIRRNLTAANTITGFNGIFNNNNGTVVALSNGSNGFTGTTSNHHFDIRVNNIVRATYFTTGNVAIGTAVDASSALLQLSSTTKGFLPPKMTSSQRTSIASPAIGLIVYQTDATEGIYVNTSSGWKMITIL